MGVNGMFIIAPPSVPRPQLSEFLSGELRSVLCSGEIRFYSHCVLDNAMNFYSFHLNLMTDLQVMGNAISEKFREPVWILIVSDSGGLVGCWKFENGALSLGYVETGCSMKDQENKYPPFQFVEDSIAECFKGSFWPQMNYPWFVDHLIFEIDDGIELYSTPRLIEKSTRNREAFEARLKRIANKKWWQFWIQ